MTSANMTAQSIKGYELLERIGSGGYGAVYRAYQSTVGREVAVKVILPRYANHPDFIRRFEAEAQLIARLEHLHIVPLYDYWRDPSGAYLVMRWLRGGSAADALKEGPLELGPAAHLLDQVASGLAVAHAAGVVHRDIKPSNILLDEEGNAYLADFGIALDVQQVKDDGQLDETIAASLEHLSPEQVRSEPITPQSDIYSLGVTLYELITGEKPFSDVSAIERLYMHISDPLPIIDNLDASVKDAVNQVVQQATAKDPRKRFGDVLAMAAAFRQAARVTPLSDVAALADLLTLREDDILRRIVEGKTNRQIAEELYIEHTTVKWYIRQIYRKLGVRSRKQAVVRALEMNLLLSQSPGEAEPQPAQSRLTVVAPEPANPYKGLRAFQAADSRQFFGRDALTEKMLNHMRHDPNTAGKDSPKRNGRFLAVVGPSGSGKSSLVKAGLIPALWQGKLPGSQDWFIVDLVPGARPLDELEIALLRVAADQGGNIRDQLQRDQDGLLRAAELILPKDGSELVVVIDQFEELFTQVPDEETRAHFLDLLVAAATDPRSRVHIVVTLRADFYDRPLHYPEFGRLVRNNLETVLPLSVKELEEAIIRPAEQVAVTYEPGLTATIIDDVLYQPGALPLLQYALTELFEKRQELILTRQAYETIGGATGALAKRAEELYLEQDEAGREATRQLFLRLVSVDRDPEAIPNTRRRVPLAELNTINQDADLTDEIIDVYAAYRLLTLDNDPQTRRPTVEVAHEALLREWDRLHFWLEESRDDLYQHRRLQILVEEWLASERDPGMLLREARLDQLSAWAATTGLSLTADESAFVQASLDARRDRRLEEEERLQSQLEAEARRADEQAASNRRLRWLAVALTALLLVALFAGFMAVNQNRLVQEQTRLAAARELAAAAQLNLELDHELAILLAMQALQQSETTESVNALHQAVQNSRLEQTLRGHAGITDWLRLSPDGASLASTSIGGTKIWNLASGEEMYTIAGQYAQFLENGGRVVTADRDSNLQRLIMRSYAQDGGTALEQGPLEGFLANNEMWWRFMFNEEMTRLAVGYEDGTAELWDTNAGQRLLQWPAHDRPVTDFVFGPQDNLLATVAGDAAVWDTATGALLFTLPANAADLVNGSSIAFSADGRFIATNSAASPGDLVIWDGEESAAAGEGRRLLTLPGHTNLINTFTFSPSGRLLATGSQDRTARVWSIAEDGGRLLLTLPGHSESVAQIAFTPDEDKLITADNSGDIRVWNILPDGQQELPGLSYPGALFRMAYNPAASQIAATSLDGQIQVWSQSSAKPSFAASAHEGMAYDIAYSPDGEQLATSGSDNKTIIWDAQSGTAQFTLAGHGEGISAGVFPNFQALAYAPDGSRIATGGADGQVKQWDTTSGAEIESDNAISYANSGQPLPVLSLAYSPDGQYLLVGGDSSQVHIFDAHTGWLRQTIDAGFRSSGFSFDPQGARLALGNWDGDVRIYDFAALLEDGASAEQAVLLSGHADYVPGTAFSPNGEYLASASLDGTVNVWNAESGALAYTLRGSGAGFSDVAFTGDGKVIMAAALDGSVRSYTSGTAELADLAQSRLTRWWLPAECRRYLHQPQCPPAPESITTVTEVAAAEQIAAAWQAVGEAPLPFLRFSEDGLLHTAADPAELDSASALNGAYQTDKGAVVIEGLFCDDSPGRYAARVVEAPQQPARLLLTVLDEPCIPRWLALQRDFTYHAP